MAPNHKCAAQAHPFEGAATSTPREWWRIVKAIGELRDHVLTLRHCDASLKPSEVVSDWW
jgi:hypothetical protein